MKALIKLGNGYRRVYYTEKDLKIEQAEIAPLQTEKNRLCCRFKKISGQKWRSHKRIGNHAEWLANVVTARSHQQETA